MVAKMKPPLIVVVGETGSGKSSLAMAVAKEYGGEIIAADSRTVYKGMDIGTAKPTKADQDEVPHYGIDLITPDQVYSAAQYKDYALEVIKKIRSRNKLPIMVGGTGLYIDGVLFDYSFSDKSDPEKRRLLNNMTHEELAKIVDKKGFSVDSQVLRNKRQMIRIIERGEAPQQPKHRPDNTLIIGLKPSRSSLRNNIEKRVEAMFRAGLRREVDDLFEKYGMDQPGFSGIVYELFRQYKAGDIGSISEIKRKFITTDLHYAKRQRTWFKRNPYIEWFDNPEDAKQRVADYLTASGYTNK